MERVLRAAFSALIGSAADDLGVAMTAAIGRDWVLVGDQLRRQLGHDVGAELGHCWPVHSALRFTLLRRYVKG
jgi:hypothetical protein